MPDWFSWFQWPALGEACTQAGSRAQLFLILTLVTCQPTGWGGKDRSESLVTGRAGIKRLPDPGIQPPSPAWASGLLVFIYLFFTAEPPGAYKSLNCVSDGFFRKYS